MEKVDPIDLILRDEETHKAKLKGGRFNGSIFMIDPRMDQLELSPINKNDSKVTVYVYKKKEIDSLFTWIFEFVETYKIPMMSGEDDDDDDYEDEEEF